MEYFYNPNYGVIMYPDSWWDVLRCWLTRLLHPSFKMTWPFWKQRMRNRSVHTIERQLTETEYPDTATAG